MIRDTQWWEGTSLAIGSASMRVDHVNNSLHKDLSNVKVEASLGEFVATMVK
jgi:hypothetical protein